MNNGSLNGHGVLKPTDKRLLNFTLPKHPLLSLNKHFSPSETPQSESSKIPLTIEKAKNQGHVNMSCAASLT